MVASKDHINSLEDHIRLLQKRIKTMEAKLMPNVRNGSTTLPSEIVQDNRLSYKKNSNDEMNMKLKNDYDPLMVTDQFGTSSKSDSKVEAAGSVATAVPQTNHVRRSSYRRNSSSQEENLVLDSLTTELQSVALDWKSLRGVKECQCSAPLDFTTRKSHCWRCGEIYCSRCLDKWSSLAGHLSQKQSPVCHQCYKLLHRSFSVESPD